MPVSDIRPFHDQLLYAFQVGRMMGEGADPFESLRVLRSIQRPEEWTSKLAAAGDDWRQRGEEAEARGKLITARQANILANHFYRAASLWNVPDPRQTRDIYLQSVACFRRAAGLSNPPIEPVQVPFEGTLLPGYLYRPYQVASRLPGVVLMGGADATKEECDGFGAQQIADRGMICLTLEGPGQGEPLYLQGLTTRPDYEVVYGAAIDYLQARPEVDAERIGVMGLSFGGYYVARAAADPRVKAAVVWGALCDPVAAVPVMLAPSHLGTFKLISGQDTAEAVRDFFARFTLDGVADRITCPVLITHGGQDGLVSPGEGHKLYEMLRGPKELAYYADGMHCCPEYMTSMGPKMFDWLQDQLYGVTAAPQPAGGG